MRLGVEGRRTSTAESQRRPTRHPFPTNYAPSTVLAQAHSDDSAADSQPRRQSRASSRVISAHCEKRHAEVTHTHGYLNNGSAQTSAGPQAHRCGIRAPTRRSCDRLEVSCATVMFGFGTSPKPCVQSQRWTARLRSQSRSNPAARTRTITRMTGRALPIARRCGSLELTSTARHHQAGVIASTRRGLPLPLTILSGAAIRTAPVGGS